MNGEISYVYDAGGNRVQKLSGGNLTATYVLALDNRQLMELNGSGALVHSNLYAPGGRLLATYDSSLGSVPGYTYNITDWLGTKRMQTTGNGSVEERCLSNPFGDVLSSRAEPIRPSTTSPAKNVTPNQETTTSGQGTMQAQWGVG